jgi:hypothetical protein
MSVEQTTVVLRVVRGLAADKQAIPTVYRIQVGKYFKKKKNYNILLHKIIQYKRRRLNTKKIYI